MPRLIVESGSNRDQVHEFTGNLVVGRDQGANLQIQDGKASREHFVITQDGGRYQLSDLGSRNGTHLNERRVAKANLRPGDRIRVGDTIFRFELDEKPHEEKPGGKPLDGPGDGAQAPSTPASRPHALGTVPSRLHGRLAEQLRPRARHPARAWQSQLAGMFLAFAAALFLAALVIGSHWLAREALRQALPPEAVSESQR